MILLINKEMQKSIIESISGIILSVWLFSALILSNQFTSYFMDFMVTAVPMVRIDTFEDLVKQKDMKIVVLEGDSFRAYLNQNDTELKRFLSSMVDPYDHDIEPSLRKLAKGFKDLSYEYITHRELVIFILIEMSIKYVKEPPSLFDILHLLERTSFLEPYFMSLNNKSHDWLKVNLKRLYVKIQKFKTCIINFSLIFIFLNRTSKCWENGLTDKWISDIYEYNRKILQSFDKRKSDLIIDFNPITLQNVFDTFYLLLFNFAISIFVFVLEFSTKFYHAN